MAIDVKKLDVAFDTRTDFPETRRVEFVFGIRSKDLDPRQVSSDMGLEPDHLFAKGDAFSTPNGPQRRSSGVWSLGTASRVASPEPQEHADALLGILEPRKSIVDALRASPGTTVMIRLWFETDSGATGFDLSPETLVRLGALCNSFTVTFVKREPLALPAGRRVN